ncbi:MAG TPA: hypothetical protein PLM14_14215 [Candidatus Hydrogenedentes bacterium]|nr:hypothetical protein [Candidatus Hydrogenedentota bacterium]
MTDQGYRLMPEYVWIASGITVTVLTVLLILHMVGRLLRNRLERVIAERFSSGQVLRKDLWAQYFGRSMKGLAQIRGNSALVLTESLLWFVQALPRTEIDIPLTSLTCVTTTRSHLGKTIFRPLLFVKFDAGEGADSIAWAVRDTEDWVQAVEAARKTAVAATR